MGSKQGTPQERFWIKVEKSGDCWIWRAYKNKSGYGVFRRASCENMMLAHRFAWEERNGNIPRGLCVCHKCDVRECVNPDHMFLGTNSDNVKDMKSKGRSPKNNGERNPRAVLSAEQVSRIKEMVGVRKEDIAKEYGVSRTSIFRIFSGKSWARPV